MPELEAVIAEVKTAKTGQSQRGPWTLYHIIDGNQVKFSTFKDAQAELARTLIGRRAKLTFEESDKGKTLTELAGPLNDDPQPGDGSWVKGKTNPDDKRSITAAVALKAAVDALSHTVPTSATPREAADKIQPLADFFFLWLSNKAGFELEPGDGILF